ncbi:hypothetical protein NE237_018347 [Protea cynaroides]|uniref:Uncharacterized protein n=1 Tax=Protea cynaroides TaxID=273540 RepID=A0A9Q0K9Q8_9MAGN|nr:hypothetical protein NE237_018347 [Protea cynaroides]
MGGCATKPKVLKGDDELAPEPAPVTPKEGSEVVNGEETKETTHEDGAKVEAETEEKVEAEAVDGEGHAVKRSLSNLLSETEKEEGKSETPVEHEEKTETETETKTETTVPATESESNDKEKTEEEETVKA